MPYPVGASVRASAARTSRAADPRGVWQHDDDYRTIRHMGVPESTIMPPSRALQASDVEAWLDQEIASLRHAVEGEAQSGKADQRSASGRSPWRQLRLFGATCTRALERVAHEGLRPSLGLTRVPRRVRRFLRTRRVDIVLYGLCIAISVVAAWLISSHGKP
jgi:hypothetical protein